MTLAEQLQELNKILPAHEGHYPLMEPCDAVKLLYQNEFGGGHLISDPDSSLRWLLREAASVTGDPSSPLFEYIGNGVVRVMLAGVREDEYPLESLNLDFVRSAALHKGSARSFAQKLRVLQRMAGEGAFGFSFKELEGYLNSYLASGCPPVSHSAAYRDAYHPAYRVILSRVSLPHLIWDIRQRLARKRRLIVALDGRCASGKTTLAKQLHDRYGWSVVHMDHFFLRPEQRSEQRYVTPGENIDHERFLEQVLLPLERGETAEYRPFDCHAWAFAPPVTAAPGAVTIVEGSYACHPSLWEHYDLRVFLTVDRSEQMRRIEARNGTEYARNYRDRWIPMEEAYCSTFELEKRCDYFLQPFFSAGA